MWSKKNNISFPMYNWIKTMFPWHRSLSGSGNIKTLKFLKSINSNLKINNFKSGSKCFDWIIPEEWNFKKAYIKHENGKTICDTKNNNLHIVQYSTAINKKMKKKDIQKKIYYIKKKPNSIPYVTSYYKKDWGFCLKYKDFKKMPNGNYFIKIDASHKKGKIPYGEIYYKGKTKKEVLFTTYICHPSMANNELSGPSVSIALSKYIKSNLKKLNYSYRFLFIPETIGSIAYIKNNLSNLKKNLICGFNLSCVGDDKVYSIIQSRLGNTLADKSLKASLKNMKKKKIYDFLSRGSDERQFCSPGVDLPYCGFSRSKYYEYQEYHTSEDNLKVVSQKGLDGSFKILKKIVDAFEISLYPKTKYLCEPKMDKRNLYEEISFNRNYLKKNIKNRMDFLAYSDGNHSIFDIVNKCNFDLDEAIYISNILKHNKLIY